ncbi:hypothetical protein CBL_20780 [Carabus blaptoides fortunei]
MDYPTNIAWKLNAQHMTEPEKKDKCLFCVAHPSFLETKGVDVREMPVSWNWVQTSKLIEIYIDYPCSYEVTNKTYSNKNKRNDALHEITSKLKDKFICPLSVEDIKKNKQFKKSIQKGRDPNKKFAKKRSRLNFLKPSIIAEKGESNLKSCATNIEQQFDDSEAGSAMENDTIIFDIPDEVCEKTTTPSVPADTDDTPTARRRKRKAETSSDYLKNATDALQSIAEDKQDEDDQFGVVMANELRSRHFSPAPVLEQPTVAYGLSGIQPLSELESLICDNVIPLTPTPPEPIREAATPGAVQSEYGVDPFTEAVTIASASNVVFRRRFLTPETIGIVPRNGYRMRDTQSKIALQWLVLQERERGIIIQHAGREATVARNLVIDGFHEATNTIFEFTFTDINAIINGKERDNAAEILKAGFKKCGIVSCDVTPLLERLHSTSQSKVRNNEESDNVDTQSSNIHTSFIEYLQGKRLEATQIKFRGKKKKLTVPTGKSFAHAEHQALYQIMKRVNEILWKIFQMNVIQMMKLMKCKKWRRKYNLTKNLSPALWVQAQLKNLKDLNCW